MKLSCPHCGLQLPMVGPRHEYCPQCLAERHQPVPLLASSLFKLGSDGDGRLTPGSGESKATARPAAPPSATGPA